MLNKRAQILFDEKTHKTLKEFARDRGSSMGELVRRAVKKTYKERSKTKKGLSLAKAAKGTFGAWKNYPPAQDISISPLSGPWSEPDEVFGKPNVSS